VATSKARKAAIAVVTRKTAPKNSQHQVTIKQEHRRRALNHILEAIIEDLEERKGSLRADRHTHTHYLKEYDAKDIVLNSFAVVLKAIERKATLVDMAVSVGRKVMQQTTAPRSSLVACHTGWFVVISYIEVGLLEHKLQHGLTKKGRASRYLTYQVSVKDRKKLLQLWDQIVTEEHVDLFPISQPPGDWTSGTHPTGFNIVKKSTPGVLRRFTPEKTPIIFNVLNKMGRTAWMVNQPIFKVVEHFMEEKGERTPLKFRHEKDARRRESLYIEAASVYRLAKKNLNNNFYHLYNADFRGRLYPATAFFHEQASDTAKGLLLLAKGDQIGEDGLYWILLHTANTFGYDKDTLDNRVEWCLSRYGELLSFARDPYSNTGWMDADKPLTFLAACNELMLIEDWVASGQTQESFISNLPLAIDGSNNGAQHLAAMGLDDELAPYVNLVPQEQPGDLYAYIGELVWEELENLEMQLPGAVYDRFDDVFAETYRLQSAYDAAPAASEKKVNAWEAVQSYRNQNRVLREALFPVYWNRIKDKRLRRKIVKRPTMTLGYGATPFGMGEQVWVDSKSETDYLGKQEKLWSNQFGRLLYRLSREKLNKLGEMLQIFEQIADRFNAREEHIEWLSPFTDFPVIQNYRKPITARTKLTYAGTTMNVNIEDWENSVLNKDSQRLGTSPNFVHSFDAAHLHLVAHRADYPLSLCHDSFGCTAGNMSNLFSLVRECFVDFYKANPLEDVLQQLDCSDLIPEKGSLKIESILESDFAFA
jgi:DNA-directed RNA polymerase